MKRLMVLVLFLLTACGHASSLVATPHNATTPSIATSPIKHIVVIFMENRTMDNLFQGFPGADTRSWGLNHAGDVVNLIKRPLQQRNGMCHSHKCFVTALDNGKWDGFDLITEGGPLPPIPDLAYSYTDPADVAPYWSLAQQYVLGDEMFQSNTGPSFPAHLYLVAGRSDDASDNPNDSVWGCDSAPGTRVSYIDPATGKSHRGGFPCFDYPTIADSMDNAGISWRYYAPTQTNHWSVFDAIRHIRYGPDWANDVTTAETYTPQADFAAGRMAQLTYVVPNNSNSDHANSRYDRGPAFVASLVDAVGRGPNWNDTAIIVTWDDWGGWYDHVIPSGLDPYGLGCRVPLLVVSPFAKKGYVSHVHYEFGSILKFIETTFGVQSLGATDVRAANLDDAFNFAQKPRRFRPLNLPPSQIQAVLHDQDTGAPDDDL